MTSVHHPLRGALRAALFSITATLALACSGSDPSGDTESSTSNGSSATNGTSATTNSTGGTSDTGSDPLECSGCADDQVCIQGECTDVPDMCPCPVETYCDLGMNKCVIGCTSDAECDEGRICDTVKRECFVGCRKDVDCGKGEICEGLSCVEGCRDDSGCDVAGEICDQMMCRPGCYADADCPLEELCDTDAKECYAGCNSIDNCGDGKICKGGVCQVGCLDISWCDAGEICKDDKCVVGCLTDNDCGDGQVCFNDKCIIGCAQSSECPLGQFCYNAECTVGCGAPGGSEASGDETRCPYGNGCKALGCDGGGNNCAAFECSEECEGSCNESAQEPYVCYEDYNMSNGLCMPECVSDNDCPNGEFCEPHAYPADNPNNVINLCRPACNSNSDCADMYFMGAPWDCQCFQGFCGYEFMMGFPLFCTYGSPG
ncbi:MAG: hypothetical protein KC486_21565 [Myxococcales bacterium]|nr:hypothetical protein [Myxococcales bacterium]